ncbi:pyridoxine 4-dehydrogenase [Pseudohyphozyma bogoriensis]|nr:pyridoxine 4-dehydrogenase [Pseudohyphozyma bogoriensis]
MTPIPTRKIGDASVGAIGYGAMRLTWTPLDIPDEQSFAPEYASKIFLTIKGAIRPDYVSDSSPEFLRQSVTNINSQRVSLGLTQTRMSSPFSLGRSLGSRKMDTFIVGRIDKTRPIEEVMVTLKTLRDEGHFKYIGLSELSAQTLRRAHAIAPVSVVEVEYSLFTTDIETNGVLDACKELGVAILAYSPLARGLLGGNLKSRSELPEGDLRLIFDRFSDEFMEANVKLSGKIQELAEKKKITLSQLCLAWLLAQWDSIIPLPGSTRVAGVEEGLVGATVTLSDRELAEIRQLLEGNKVLGLRYNAMFEDTLAA